MEEKMNAAVTLGAVLSGRAGVSERARATGAFTAEHRNAAGELLWSGGFPNTVVTLGKNLALDTFLAGSAYTVTGPYMGLISLASFSAIAAADTMASHAGWLEAGVTNAPTYTVPRKTCVWSAAAAGAKALSAALTFVFTGAGTVKGVFLVYGTGALATVDNTAGTLLSAGLLPADRLIAIGDSLAVSYSMSL